MPRAKKPRAYDWVASDDDRRGPQGRPRLGPKGVAIRQLPRLTVRAPAADLAMFDAIREALGVSPHLAFAAVVSAWLSRQGAATAARVTARARAIRRERYPDVP